MYQHAKEVIMRRATGEDRIDLTSTGDVATWGCGLYAHKILAWSITCDATPGDAGVVKLDVRLARDSDTGRTDGTAGTINLATTHVSASGAVTVVYQDLGVSGVIVYPGYEVIAEVTDASASVDEALIVLLVEPIFTPFAGVTSLASTVTMTATA